MIENFGKNVARLRREKNLSQEQLADMVEVNKQTVSNIERGARYPTFDTLERIASALEANPIELFGTDEEIALLNVPNLFDEIDSYNQKVNEINEFYNRTKFDSKLTDLIENYSANVKALQLFVEDYQLNRKFAQEVDAISEAAVNVKNLFEDRYLIDDSGNVSLDHNGKPVKLPSNFSTLPLDQIEEIYEKLQFIKENQHLID